MSAALSCAGLDVVAGTRTLVAGLDLGVAAGELLCVLGINGAGKTSTLETLCGLRAAGAGSLRICGEDPKQLTRPALARLVGLMTQRGDDGFVHQVLPLVAMGRHAHKRFWEWQDDSDLVAARQALARVDLRGFDLRSTDTLSGGEAQRLALAMLLVQEPRVMLLDEPLSQLDPRHQRNAMRLLHELRDDGHALIVSVHDINVAARLADRILLLSGDGGWRLGSRDETLGEELLSELYGTPIRAYETPDGRLFAPG